MAHVTRLVLTRKEGPRDSRNLPGAERTVGRDERKTTGESKRIGQRMDHWGLRHGVASAVSKRNVDWGVVFFVTLTIVAVIVKLLGWLLDW